MDSLKNFFEKLNLSNIAYFFEKFSLDEIYQLDENDLKDIIDDKQFIKERIKLRKFLFLSSGNSKTDGFKNFDLRKLVENDRKTKFLH